LRYPKPSAGQNDKSPSDGTFRRRVAWDRSF
jgi:hypothetical protein